MYTGHFGRLCALCNDSYVLSTEGCIPCENGISETSAVIVTCIVLGIVVWYVIVWRPWLQIFEDQEVWIGNAAQTLHPVAGQGLNLGLRDAITLANCLGPVFARQLNHSTVISTLIKNALSQYAKERRSDRQMTIGITDLMANLFTSQFIPIVAARGLALATLQWLPPLKNALARQMMFGKR